MPARPSPVVLQGSSFTKTDSDIVSQAKTEFDQVPVLASAEPPSDRRARFCPASRCSAWLSCLKRNLLPHSPSSYDASLSTVDSRAETLAGHAEAVQPSVSFQSSGKHVNMTVVDNDFAKLLSHLQVSKEELKAQKIELPHQFLEDEAMSSRKQSLSLEGTRNLLDSTNNSFSSSASSSLSTSAESTWRPSRAAPPLSTSNQALDTARPSSRSRLFGLQLHLRILSNFFHPTFADPHKENAYRKEKFFQNKLQALASALYLFATWIAFVAALLARMNPQKTLYVRVAYFGVCSFGAVAPLILVAGNIPYTRPILWEICLFIAVWSIPTSVLFEIYTCQFFAAPTHQSCSSSDFIGFFTYPIAFPTIALFMLGAKRWSIALGGLAFIVEMCVTVIPDRNAWIKSIVNYTCFLITIICASYLWDKNDRRAFMLRTDLKAQFKETQQAQIAQRRAAESKRGFTSYIFHEVRVPLNTALLACQNLETEKVFNSATVDQQDVVEGLSSSLHRMERVLNDVLDFQRMEAGKLSWTNQPFDLHSVAHLAGESFHTVAVQKNIELRYEFDPAIDNLQKLLTGDKSRTSQVITNLLSNAIKFTPEHGRVTCRTILLFPKSSKLSASPVLHDTLVTEDVSGDQVIVRIEIEDTGMGVNPRDLAGNKLFSPYVQTELGRRQGGKGSGLGLALVRENVNLAQGRLGVCNRQDKGATFWVELRFGMFNVPRSSNKTRQNGSLPPGSASKPTMRKVLVVDDDPVTIKIMSSMLVKRGHRVESASTGPEAIELAVAAAHDSRPFDVILIDNQMTVGFPGADAVAQMRKQGIKARIIGCSGDTDASQDFIDAGTDENLIKPVSIQQLLEAVEGLKDM